MQNSQEKTLRLDKWLKIALIFKTRSKAADACLQGRIKVNDQSAKASKIVKIGDTITIKMKWRKRKLDILDIVGKSIKAADAKLLYHEHEMTSEEKEAEDIRGLFYKAASTSRPKYKGRPTKKERRDMEKFRNNNDAVN